MGDPTAILSQCTQKEMNGIQNLPISAILHLYAISVSGKSAVHRADRDICPLLKLVFAGHKREHWWKLGIESEASRSDWRRVLQGLLKR